MNWMLLAAYVMAFLIYLSFLMLFSFFKKLLSMSSYYRLLEERVWLSLEYEPKPARAIVVSVNRLRAMAEGGEYEPIEVITSLKGMVSRGKAKTHYKPCSYLSGLQVGLMLFSKEKEKSNEASTPQV